MPDEIYNFIVQGASKRTIGYLVGPDGDFLRDENDKLVENPTPIMREYLKEYQQMPTNKKFEVWMEGYSATGQRSEAQFLGIAEVESFEEACRKVAGDELDRTDLPDRDSYKSTRPSIWGCRLFDNEADARKTFG